MKKTLTIILSIILVLLLGCIAYQLVNTNKEDIKDDVYEEIKDLKVILDESPYLTDSDKLDETKPFIYEIASVYEEEVIEGITEKNFKDEFKTTTEMTGDYTVPYINIKLDNANEINKWLKFASLMTNQAKGSMYGEDKTYLKYECNQYNNIYSIFVEGSIYGYEFKQGINIDMQNKKIMNLNDVINYFNIKIDDKEYQNTYLQSTIDMMNKDKANENDIVIDSKLFDVFQFDSIGIKDPICDINLNDINEFNYSFSKKKIYLNEKYVGYVLNAHDFILDDGSIDKKLQINFTNKLFQATGQRYIDSNGKLILFITNILSDKITNKYYKIILN